MGFGVLITKLRQLELLQNTGPALGDPLALVLSALIFVFALLLFLYAMAMNNRGVLL